MAQDKDFATFIQERKNKPVPFFALGVVIEAFKELQAKTKDLERRLSDTENKSVNFCGVWQEGKAYGVGSAVTRQGSLWIALRATSGTPGGPTAADRDWQLAVKRGSV